MESRMVIWRPTFTVVVGPVGADSSTTLESVLAEMRRAVPAALHVTAFSSPCGAMQCHGRTITQKQNAVRIEVMATRADGSQISPEMVLGLRERFQGAEFTTERGIPDSRARVLSFASSESDPWIREFTPAGEG